MSKPVNKKEKRAEILEATINVLAAKGVAGVTIQDIADNAGMAKGTLYLYFKNKDEILREVLHYEMGSNGQEIIELMNSDLSAETKLRLVIAKHIEAMLSSKYPVELIPEIWSAVIRSSEKHSLESSIDHFITFMAPILSQVLPNGSTKAQRERVAAGLIALFHGLIILHVINPEKYSIHEIADTVFDYLVKK